MVTLDRKEIRFSVQLPTGTPAGMYTYSLYRYDDNEADDILVFVGNFYYDGSNRYVTLEVGDILRNQKYFPDLDTDVNTQSCKLVQQFCIKVNVGGNIYPSSYYRIAMVYQYPHKLSYTNADNVYVSNPYSSEHSVPLQGLEYNGSEYKLIPHYPLKETYNFYFTQAFVTGNNCLDFELAIEGGTYGEDTTIYQPYEDDFYSRLYTCSIGDMITWEFPLPDDTYRPASDLWGDHDLTVTDSDNGRVIAILDNCYQRYYLLWQDRLGGYQSQAFLDNAIYSETFSVTETQNYINERKKSFISIQPKIKLNSGWIAEDVYPLYESIFVSPTLKLYDSYEDKVYDVITNGNFTEEKYKNGKKLLNLSLDLELIRKQNIIY